MDEQAWEKYQVKLTILFFQELDNSTVPWTEYFLPKLHTLKPHSSQEGTERHWGTDVGTEAVGVDPICLP